MRLPQVLDLVEGLLRASEHPDIVSVDRYGTSPEPWGPNVATSRTKSVSGIRVTYTATSTAMLAGQIEPKMVPVPMPAEMPPPTQRLSRLPIFVAQLLDVARPAEVASWQLVAHPQLGPKDRLGTQPGGITIVFADGTQMLLLCQATGAMTGTDPAEEPFPDYQIPEGVKTWHLKVGSGSAG
jgi:hypothetical protein